MFPGSFFETLISQKNTSVENMHSKHTAHSCVEGCKKGGALPTVTALTVPGMTIMCVYFLCRLACIQPLSIFKDSVCQFASIHSPQVSIQVAASHKASQHQALISQIQMVGPYAILS